MRDLQFIYNSALWRKRFPAKDQISQGGPNLAPNRYQVPAIAIQSEKTDVSAICRGYEKGRHSTARPFLILLCSQTPQVTSPPATELVPLRRRLRPLQLLWLH